MSRVRVVNRSDRELNLPHPQTGVEMSWAPAGHPGDYRDYAPEMAQYAMDHFGPFLEVVTPGNKDLTEQQQKAQEFWLGNFSGDPDAWEERAGEVWSKEKGRHMGVIRNANKQPATFRASLGKKSGPEVTPKGFWLNRTYPGYVVTIPAYSRIKVTADQFSVLIQRDAEQSQEYAGRIMEARGPTDFEPELEDDKWTIDRLRTWLKLCPAAPGGKAGKDVCGPSEKELVAQMTAEGLSGEQLEDALYTARYDLWVRCRLRAMNLNIKIPSEKDFNAAVAREAKAEKGKAA